MFERTDFAIVNRSFWPESPVIGGALLALAEKVAESKTVCVITQSNENIIKALNNSKKGKGVHIKACRPYSSVNSNIPIRLLDGFIFMLWTVYSLLITRPRKVYISTNPPIFIPFFIFLYCYFFRAKYYYHLQDIHPEAANIIMPLNKLVFSFLSWMDSIVMRHATGIITLSEEMRNYILYRSKTLAPIILVDNPAFTDQKIPITNKTKDIVFCGTAGRLQEIPLLLNSIREYLNNGGKLKFTFIGYGIYFDEIKDMSKKYRSVSCLGYLSGKEAAAIVSQHRWALLPINDKITSYAFPSRSSSYVVSNCKILAICSAETSVAAWVNINNLGLVSNPDIRSIIECYGIIEETISSNIGINIEIDFSVSYFVEKIINFTEFQV